MAKHALPILVFLLVLTGCGTFDPIYAVQDSYGNRYGGYYEHGDNYSWQLQTCERETASPAIPSPQRPYHMRCCMWHHGVPIAHPETCQG